MFVLSYLVAPAYLLVRFLAFLSVQRPALGLTFAITVVHTHAHPTLL